MHENHQHGKDSKSIFQHTHLFGLGLNSLVSLAGLIGSVILIIWTLNASCDTDRCLNKPFLASTYLATPATDTQIGWPVATERVLTADSGAVQPTQTTSWGWGHYYDCMATANFAKTKCGSNIASSSAAYVACLKGTASINATLAACNAYSSAYQYQWPTPEQYIRCMAANPDMEIGRYQTNLFGACLRDSFWPFYEVPQGVDSQLLTGAFNWVLYMVVGLWCMVGFSVYAMSPYETGEVEQGQPESIKRLGAFFAVIVTIWQFIMLILVIVVTCRNTTVWNSAKNLYPMTGSTSLVTLVATGACFFYFLAELSQAWGVRLDDHVRSGIHKVRKAFYGRAETRLEAGPMPYQSLVGKTYKISEEAKGVEMYVAPLLATYADGYLVDSLILLGIAGATNQLTTDCAWNILTLSLLYRLCNMALARSLYEGFMRNPSETSLENDSKRTTYVVQNWEQHTGGRVEVNGSLNIKVMALSAQFGVLFLFVALGTIIYDTENPIGDSSWLKNFFVLGYIIPEVIRTCMHLLCQFRYTEDYTWELYNVTQFVWIWDVAVRLAFCFIVFVNQDVGSPGTLTFLQDKYYTLSQASLLFGA